MLCSKSAAPYRILMDRAETMGLADRADARMPGGVGKRLNDDVGMSVSVVDALEPPIPSGRLDATQSARTPIPRGAKQ